MDTFLTSELKMITISKMTYADIDSVLKIEKECFGEGWSSTPFSSELSRKDCAYFIARDGDKIVGYSGYWLILEELHVIIMAVHPSAQRKKIGQLLLMALIDDGMENGARWATLEVKATNIPAQKLYEKFGFTVKGRRKNYYQQDRQDALIMWTDDLDGREFLDNYRSIKNETAKV